jgi:HEAT repeat protein
VKQLQSKEVLIRRNAAMALKEYGPRGKAALSQLIQMIKETEPKVREQVTMAICKIDFDTAVKEGLHPENME